MSKWKMIGIRVLEDSDLSARLRELSDKTRLTYSELLEKFVAQAESEIDTPAPSFNAEEFAALREQIKYMSLRFDDLSAKVKVLEDSPSTTVSAPSEHTQVTIAPADKAETSVEAEAIAGLLESSKKAANLLEDVNHSDTAEIPPSVSPGRDWNKVSKKSLSESQIKEIKKLAAEGETQSALAKKFGVCRKTIRRHCKS